jgi:hypothetical protein
LKNLIGNIFKILMGRGDDLSGTWRGKAKNKPDGAGSWWTRADGVDARMGDPSTWDEKAADRGESPRSRPPQLANPKPEKD